MKLTKLHKAAFVASVMNDLPESADDIQAKFNKLLQEDMERQAPKALKEALKNKELRHYIFTGSDSWRPDSIKGENHFHSPYSLGISAIVTYRGYKPSPEIESAANALMQDALSARNARSALESKVTQAISGFNTLKSAREGLPEFAKYLPEESTRERWLPAVANLSAELIKAGWSPKFAKEVAEIAGAK